jgi:hypothetical protein
VRFHSPVRLLVSGDRKVWDLYNLWIIIKKGAFYLSSFLSFIHYSFVTVHIPLAFIMPQHLPTTFSPESSSLSSAPTNLTAHEDIVQRVNAVLKRYESTGTNDHTVITLEAFVKYLPRDGARNISDDILGCNSNEELGQLASHLLTGLLLPSQYIYSILI